MDWGDFGFLMLGFILYPFLVGLLIIALRARERRRNPLGYALARALAEQGRRR